LIQSMTLALMVTGGFYNEPGLCVNLFGSGR